MNRKIAYASLALILSVVALIGPWSRTKAESRAGTDSRRPSNAATRARGDGQGAPVLSTGTGTDAKKESGALAEFGLSEDDIIRHWFQGPVLIRGFVRTLPGGGRLTLCIKIAASASIFTTTPQELGARSEVAFRTNITTHLRPMPPRTAVTVRIQTGQGAMVRHDTPRHFPPGRPTPTFA